MIIFRNVNAIALRFFGPLFYIIPLAIYVILKYKNRNNTLQEGFATFEKRALAFIIDYALIEGLAVGMHFVFAKMENPPVLFGTLFILGFALFNLVFLPTKTGWSIGKRVVGIKIIKKDNKPLGIYDLLYREIVKSWFSLSIIYLGCFWMFIGKSQLTWHDSIADTRVYNLKWRAATPSLKMDRANGDISEKEVNTAN